MEITTNSRGHFEFDLCPQVTETDTCFQRLNIVGGDRQVRNGNMMCSGSGGNHPNGPVRARIHIPPGVRCTRCTLRWTYRTSHAPGNSHAAQGGRYDNGIITGTYVASQVVEVTMEITTNSRGHFEFDLCPQVTETDTCFQRLNIVGGDRQVRNGNMMCSGSGGNHPNGPVRARIHIPPGVRCTRCTLRWTYRTSHAP
ncbi:hypothetical protein HA402_009364, partial [Bradysia odoriphaga]